MRIDPETLASASSRHPIRTLLIWVGVLGAAIAANVTLLGGALTTEFDFTNEPEAKRAERLVNEAFPGSEVISETWVVTSDRATVEDPAFAERVNSVLTQISELGRGVVKAAPASFPPPDEAQADPQAAALGPLRAADGSAVLFNVVLTGEVDDAAEHVDEFAAIRDEATGDGFRALTLGEVTSTEDFKAISEEDLRTGEGIGVVVALLVLVLVFGAAVAGVTPLIMGIFAIAVSLGIVGLLGTIWKFTFFAPNLISMMGLAVGIDYSLFIVSRYREERVRGRDKLDAIRASGATANRAVFFSGVTVVLALAGMLIIPTTIFRGLAGGAIIVVLVSVAASMTLLPAVIALLGDKLNAGRILGRKRPNVSLPGREGGFWDRMTRTVMAHPIRFLVSGVALMVVLASPYFLQPHADGDGNGLKSGLAGISTLPDDVQTRQAFNALVERFPEIGADSPAQLVIQGDVSSPTLQEGLERLDESVGPDPALGAPVEPKVAPDGSLAIVELPLTGPATDPQSDEATEAIARLREQHVPHAFRGTGLTVLAGGDTAFIKDFFDISSDYTPVILALVLALSFLLLTVVFRSIVVPIKAIIMNLLSVGAAYGAIVAVFQKGGPAFGTWIADASGFQQVAAIEAWLPLFLFSILFGLSMDYHVFLLTRIREEFDKSGDNTEAVAFGLRTTAGIITGAAVIMVAVFAGFAAGRLVPLEQMGFGLAVAVFLDATVIRSIIVPSSMRLLGNVNWYLPAWLQWLPELNVEGFEAEPVPIGEPRDRIASIEADALVEAKD